MRDIQQWMDMVAQLLPITDTQYPARMCEVGAESRLAFDVKHSLLHLQKTLGNIATSCEQFDHGDKELSPDVFRRDVARHLISVLRLSAIVNLSNEDVYREIQCVSERTLREFLTTDPVLLVHEKKTAKDRKAIKLVRKVWGDRVKIQPYIPKDAIRPSLLVATSKLEGLESIESFVKYIQKFPAPEGDRIGS